MSANRARDTSPEVALRRALRAKGLVGYRLHPRSVPGRPDVAYLGRRVAVFVHGCFWHACPTCALPTPRSNSRFWEAKFARNRARDEAKAAALGSAGWRVVTVWEHEILADPTRAARRVQKAIERQRRG